jgi:hypothetical protein
MQQKFAREMSPSVRDHPGRRQLPSRRKIAQNRRFYESIRPDISGKWLTGDTPQVMATPVLFLDLTEENRD